jgi:hypothetical protein
MAVPHGRSTWSLDGEMAARYHFDPIRVAAETAAAVVTGVALGPLALWLGYLTLRPSQLISFALAPSALSLAPFVLFALWRLPRHDMPTFAVALTTLIGLVTTFLGSTIAIVMVGCHFGDCINL